MQKKILTSIIIVCLLGIVLFIFLFLKKESQVFDKSIYQAIPTNSALFFEIKNYKTFTSNTQVHNEIWNTLSAFNVISQYNSFIADIDSTLSRNQDFEILADNSIIISVQQIGKNKLEFLFLIPIQNEKEIDVAHKFMRTKYHSDSTTEFVYNNLYPITSFVSPKTNTSKISYGITKETLIISESRILVENAIKSIHSEQNLTQDSLFTEVQRTAGDKVPANLYVNLRQISNIGYLYAHPKIKGTLLRNPKFGSWCEFDINMYPNYVLLNGFTSITDNSDYFSIFQNQTPVSFEIQEIMPAGTSMFLSLGIQNKHSFQQQYEQYLHNTLAHQQYASKIAETNKTLSSSDSPPIDIKKTIYSLLDDEIAMVYGYVNSLDIYENTFAILKVSNQSIAREKLLGIIDTYAHKHNKKIQEFTSTYKIDDNIQYTIYQFPVRNLPEKLWGTAFSHTSAEYLCFIENYVVFGNSVSALSKFIHAYELKKTLNNDRNFAEFSEKLLTNYSWYFYSNISKSYEIYPEYVDAKTTKVLQNNAKKLQKFEGFAFQVAAEHKTLYNNVLINYNPGSKDGPRTIWESYLDTIVITKPKIIENFHTGKKNIIVQDAHNNLYFINSLGVIQWKKQLKEPIISEIHEIDFYKNNKIQYLFNTQNYLYIIDRIGNFVERYPIKLESEASAGLSVFDYDKSRDYRICIPAKNKKIYLLSIDGNTLKGWDFGRTETIVSNPVQHFRIGTKDYIVCSDENNIYILNRRGETRIPVTKLINKSKNNNFIYEPAHGNTPHRLITTAKDGTIISVNFKGKITKKTILSCSENHFFEYRDMNKDGIPDYIFLDKDELQVYSQNGSKLFSYSFDADITHPLSIYYFGNKNYKIGVVDSKNSKIYLINGNGSLHKGFPLKGKTLFSIGFLYKNTQTFNLIIGGDNYFLYNYEVK
ncbi:MAG: hypothetical protein PF481_00505 [Bacteroidales bacterium]|jgi:hypothetical protein|nr:hypothetical protein [Bacteroidales bacterium]